MTFYSYDEPPNIAELRAAERLVESAWPEKPERPPTLATGQGRAAAENGEAGRVIVAVFGLLALIGLAGLGYRVLMAVIEKVLG